MLVASFPKFGHSAFAWVSLAPLLVALALPLRGPFHAFTLGLLTGFVYFAGTQYWVVNVMAIHGGLPFPVAALVGLLFVAYLAVYPGLFALLVARAVGRFGIAGLWLAPGLWVASEWGRSQLAFGFLWVPLGSSQATALPIAQLASVTGVYGLSALVALVATAAAVVSLSRRAAQRAAAGAVALLLVVVTVWGTARVSEGRLADTGTPLRVGLVQGSIDQAEKWDPRFRDVILERHLELSRQVIAGGADVVIWPEASTPFYLDADAPLAEPIRRLAAQTETPFLVGTDEFVPGDGNEPDRYYNSASLIGRDGRTRQTYRKMFLVPFGEYVPFKRLLFFVGPLVEAVSDFTPGEEAVVLDTGGARLSAAICYESVYPSIAREFVERGSQLLVTITNDAWFGRSSAPYQHFEQGMLRAIEQGRYLVRAANTGISGVVDPYGRIVRTTDLFVPATVVADVRLHDGRTVYSLAGDLAVWLSLAVLAWFLAVSWPRRQRG